MSGTLECDCGFKMTIERIEDAPPCCPGCGGGQMPEEGMTKKQIRAAKAAHAREKLKQGKVMKKAFAKLAKDMDAMRAGKPEPDLEPPGAA